MLQDSTRVDDKTKDNEIEEQKDKIVTLTK